MRRRRESWERWQFDIDGMLFVVVMVGIIVMVALIVVLGLRGGFR